MTTPTIGFIGIGKMGSVMSRRLLDAGYPLVVHDAVPKACEPLVQAGAKAAPSAKALAAASDVVITMVPDSKAVEAVVLGKDGVLEGIRKGRLVIDMSSSYPSSTRKLAATLKERGVRMLDAPVSGGVLGAQKGTLAVMVGGDAPDYEEASPIFKALGASIFHVGGHGAGHVVKAMNNYLSASLMVATTEALLLATKAGLSPKTALEVLNKSSGRSFSSEFKFPNYVLSRKFNSGFTVGLMNKDLDIFTSLGREIGVPMFAASIVKELFGYAVAQGGAQEDHSAIVKYLEAWAKVELKDEGTGS